jgi:hypothetical protein
MKKKILLIGATVFLFGLSHAQTGYTSQMQTAVTKLNKAESETDYQQLADQFLQIASLQNKQWLPMYYAAFCHAKIGWLLQNDPDNIEQWAAKSLEEIRQAESMLDTANQKKELSEVYVVLSMANRSYVFINGATYGRKYGPVSARYIALAEQVNPDNPRALYLEGWQKYYTPKLWGGDKTKGKEILMLAKQKMNSQPTDGIEPHWGNKEIDAILNQP